MWSTWRTHFTVLYSSVWERLCVQRTWWELSWVQTRVERGRRWRRREEERCSRKGVGGRKNIADIPDDLCRVLEGRRSLIFGLCSVSFSPSFRTSEPGREVFVICRRSVIGRIRSGTLWFVRGSFSVGQKIIQMWEIRHSWKVIIPDICI